MNRKNRFISLNLVVSLCFLGWGGDTDPNTSSQAGKTSGSISPEPNESEWIEKIKNLDPHIISLLRSPGLTIQALNFIKETDLDILNMAVEVMQIFNFDNPFFLDKFVNTTYILDKLRDIPGEHFIKVDTCVKQIREMKEEIKKLQDAIKVDSNSTFDENTKKQFMLNIYAFIKEYERLIQNFIKELTPYFDFKDN